MYNYAFPSDVSRFGCLARKIDEGPIEPNLWPVMSECCADVHHTYDLMCDDFGFPSSPPAPCAHSIRLWIFPQCLNPFQHKNNTTHPNVFCRLEKKEKNFFHPHRRSHFFPIQHDACSLSFVWYRMNFLCVPFTFHFYTDDGKNTIHRTTTSCRSFQNNINIFKWIDDNKRKKRRGEK